MGFLSVFCLGIRPRAGKLKPERPMAQNHIYRWVIVAAGGLLGCVAAGSKTSSIWSTGLRPRPALDARAGLPSI